MKTRSSYIVHELQYVSSNTPHHGCGDYPEYIWRRVFTIFACSEGQAKAHIRRMHRPGTIRFGGRSPNRRLELEQTVNLD